MGEVVGFVRLDWQALFAPTPEWEAAAQQVLAQERARVHAAEEEEEEGK